MARGDHLFVYCKGYSHHGIDCGEGRVVHFESDPWRKVRGTVFRQEPPVVREVSYEEFSLGREVFVRAYDTPVAPDVVVARARARIGESGYHIFDNNCEHFAVWCKSGNHVSTQINALREAWRPTRRALAASSLLCRYARRLPTQARPFAYGAALAITTGSFAWRYAQHRLESISRGES